MTQESGWPSACERVRGRLERLLDGGLEPVEEARDLGHLEACSACAAERAGWEDFMGLLRRAEAPRGASLGAFQEAREELSESVAGRIAQDRVRERRATKRGIFLSLATAAAAMMLIGGIFSVAETTPGLPRAGEISRLDLKLPAFGDLLSRIGSLGTPR